MTLFVKIIFVFLFLFQLLDLVKADRCTDNSYCSGGYYCCRYGGAMRCCGRAYFWRRWYVWFGLAMFFFLIGLCMIAYRRRQRLRLSRMHNPPVTATVVSQSGMTTYNPPPMPPQQNPPPPFITDAPPSYEDLTKQGVLSQYQQYPKQQLLPAGSPPAIDETSTPPYPVQPPVAPAGSQAPPYPGN